MKIISEEEKARELLVELTKANIKINKFELKRPTLEEIFVEKVGGNNK